MRVATRLGAMTAFAFIATADFAEATEIRVYTSGAPAAAVRVIAADFAQQTGHHLSFTVGQPADIQKRLKTGEEADVIILPSSIVARLSKSGGLHAGSTVDLARVGIGVVVRDGAQHPDISSAAALKVLLLSAHSVVYPDPQEQGGGSAGRAIEAMIERMGIADTIKAKRRLASAIGGGVAMVAAGKAEVGLFNVSEIMPIKGVSLVGPLPAELQNYIVFSAAIPANSTSGEPAASFIKMLGAPAARAAWQQAGLEPVDATAPK
jgi:molybdate transport system substrate-binding protein